MSIPAPDANGGLSVVVYVQRVARPQRDGDVKAIARTAAGQDATALTDHQGMFGDTNSPFCDD